MPSPIPSPAPSGLRALASRRGGAIVFALLIEALLLLALLSFTPAMRGNQQQGSLFTFDVTASNDQSHEKKQAKREEKRAAKTEQKPQPKPPEPVPTPEPPAEFPPNFIHMSSRDFAATDVTRFPRSAAPASGAAQSQGDSDAGPDSALAGKGPNGQPLYAAEWYRRPTHAELSTYMPQRVRGPGWGVIACRTVENFRVEDCKELGESPVGSGYAGAVRQAAWQFRVRPPRIGGKSQVGAWVSIQITYTERGGNLND